MRGEGAVDDVANFGSAGLGIYACKGVGWSRRSAKKRIKRETRTLGSGVILELRFKVLDPSWASRRRCARVKREIPLAVGIHSAQNPRCLSCEGCGTRENEWIHMADDTKYTPRRTQIEIARSRIRHDESPVT